MTREEAINLFNELSGVVGQPSIPEAVKHDVRRLYRYVTGDTLKQCNCPDLYSDAIIVIRLKLKTMSEKQSYKLKRGVVIQPAGTNQAYTRDNITDEVAREYLKKYPNKANLFDAIPEVEEQTEEQPEPEDQEQPEVEEQTETEEKPKANAKSKKRK